MQKHRYGKLGLIACIALLAASFQVHADMASASGILADIAAALTEANANLAAAANGNDQAALQAAQEQVDKVKAASEDALEAYEALENAQTEEEAEAAEDALEQAQEDAEDAIGDEDGDDQGDDGGEAGEEDDDALPNPYDVPWESDALRDLYKELFNTVQSASSQGGSEFPEADATSI